jgi:hypothetical protein
MPNSSYTPVIYRCNMWKSYRVQQTACAVPGDVLAQPLRRAEAPTLEATHRQVHAILSLQHHELTTLPSAQTTTLLLITLRIAL